MKILILISLCLGFSNLLKAQDTIVAKQAKAYMGKQVIVCDKVTGRSYLNGNKTRPVILYVGPKYPNQYLTLYFSRKVLEYFVANPDEKMVNKRFCLKGTISKFRGKPAIYVKSRGMLNAEE